VKELIEAVSLKIKSTIFGYTFLTFFVLNWKPLIYLFASSQIIENRFEYFDLNTSIHTVLTLPIIFALAFSIANPWINYGVLWICRRPTDLKNVIQAESEHSLLTKKQELEKVRSDLLASMEEDLIERAKRDQELGKIEDETAKNKTKEAIDKLREERDELAYDPSLFPNSMSPERLSNNNLANEMAKQNADSLRQLAEMARQQDNFKKAEEYLLKAVAIEQKFFK
jgi:hypothetical protein